MIARPSKAALRVTALLAVVAGALWAVASAGATHIGGATYNGTITGAGSLSFTVSGNGSEITYLSTPGPIPGNGCTYSNLDGSISEPITNHQFNDPTPPVYFSGTFGEKQSASGTFRIDISGCDTGYLSWNATTTAEQGEQCVVPNLKNKKKKKAKKNLAEANCTLGNVKKEESSKVPKGRIISQKPKAGTVLPAGSPVEIKVSTGPD